MKIELSVLIPSYNYVAGIIRILKQLSNVSKQVEIIISDNSTNDDIKDLVKKNKRSLNLKYFLREPGAVANWNYLINLAKGKYIWILHDSEALCDEKNLNVILKNLKGKKPDVLVMPVELIFSNQRNRLHIPIFIQKLLLKHFKTYILHRNYIGPMPALIAKRRIVEKFDINLKWLVDQEWYYRIFKNSKDILFLPNIKIASFQNKNFSITDSMRKKIPIIKKNVMIYIANKHKITNQCLLETLFWFLVRLLSRTGIFK